MTILIFLILIIFILIRVAFFTLLERKTLRYIQCRKGPNKVGYIGLLQPFSDGIKLFRKEMLLPRNSNLLIFFLIPLLNIFLRILIWILLPYLFTYIFFNIGILLFICLSGLRVYTIILIRWSSNSHYSLLGRLRIIAQLISYEISLSLILLSSLILVNRFSLYEFFLIQKKVWIFFCLIPIGIIWLISCFAETNRAPFDFSEGESELVSGFNIEYSSIFFAYIFLAEYSRIIFISILTVIFFLGGNFFSLIFYVKISLLCFFFIWVRGSIPRFRYDKLIYINWKIFLPISILSLIIFSRIRLIIILPLN